jgi:hypothetical protein
MVDDWEYKSIGPAKIDVSKVFNLIKYKKLKPVKLNIDDVAYKSIQDININSIRYKIANDNFPLLVIEGMENPYNKKYRMIDGRHRLKKQLNKGYSELWFYVLQESDILHYIQKI